MIRVERYGITTCDEFGEEFEGRGMSIAVGIFRLEVSLTRREAPQGRTAARSGSSAARDSREDKGADAPAQEQRK